MNPLLSLLTVLVVLGLISWFFWPERGLFSWLRRTRHYQRRVWREDALKHLYKSYVEGIWPTLESLAGSLQISTNAVIQVLQELQEAGLVECREDRYNLTWDGQQYALHIIRAHRLWERYLADHTGFGELDWHRQAEQREHDLSREDVAQLSSQLGYPLHDPHGDPIPSVSGEWKKLEGQSLNQAPLRRILRIVHIEDEPEILYAQILAEDLHPGLQIQLVERNDRVVHLQTQGREIQLAPLVAANILVAEEESVPEAEESCCRLSGLRLGEKAYIQKLSPSIRGLERRRLLDLGLLPGTLITAELESPAKDPVGYRVRGTLIALRKDQTRHIWITPPPDHPPTLDATGNETSHESSHPTTI